MNDEEAIETISSNEWRELQAASIDVFDDRPTLRSPLPPPPPPTRRKWSTLLREAATLFTALSDAVSDLERRRWRARRR